MSRDCAVERLFQGAFGTVPAGVADIRRALDARAGIRDIRDTGSHTFTAGPAGSVRQGCASGTLRTGCALSSDIKQTVIESPAHGARFFFMDMFAYLLGNGSTVFAKDEADFLEG